MGKRIAETQLNRFLLADGWRLRPRRTLAPSGPNWWQPCPSMKPRLLALYRWVTTLVAIGLGLSLQAQPKEASFNGYCHSFRLLMGTASSAGLGFDILFTSYDGSASSLLFDTDAAGYAIFSDELSPSFSESGVYRTDYALYVNKKYNAAGTISATFPTVDLDQNGIADFLQKNKQVNASVSGKLLRQLPSLAPEIVVSGQIVRSAGSSQGTYSFTGRDPEVGNITYRGDLYLVNLLGKLKYNPLSSSVTIEADLEREGGAVLRYTSTLDYSIADVNTISFPAGKFTNPNLPDSFTKAFVLKRTGNRYLGRLEFVDAFRGTSWPDYTAWQLEVVDTNDFDLDGVPDLSDPPVVQSPPTISVQPVSQTRTVGEAVALTVQASGSGVLSYSWRKNGVPVLNVGGVSGADGPTLSFAAVQLSQAGGYSVVVSNLVGAAVSSVATLTVNPAAVGPTIVGQPQPVTVPLGQMATFAVVATGTEPLAYQWKRNGVNLPGATASTLTINQPQASDAGDYSVVVSNSVGIVSSVPAKLTVEGGSVSTAAQAVAVIRGGLVASITITDGGFGYTKEPTVTMSGGGGTGATAKAFIENGRVVAVVILSSGSGYTGAPTVTIDAPPKSVGLKIELIPKLTVQGPVGQTARVEWAAQLSGPWTTWTNVVVGPEGTVLVDLAAGVAGRLYRAVEVSQPVGPSGFVWIPPGTFVMGSPIGETYRGDDEIQHTVTLTRGFWISRHEVTQGEYEMVMGSSPAGLGGSNFNPSGLKGPNFPVNTVSWEEAVIYCQKLTDRERKAGRIRTDQVFRLPTEAEWEYSARAGATGPTYGELDATAWQSLNSGLIMHEVGLKQPNAWGVYDMLGNVWEWCADWYGEYPTGSAIDPIGPTSGSSRVRRGGGWGFNSPGAVRLANRRGVTANGLMGFRPVLSTASVGTIGFTWVAPGTFVMGSPISESERSQDENQHTVILTRGFWLSDHEVTQVEYETLMENNPSTFRGDPNLPVESVTWHEAVDYCSRLTERERSAGRITAQQVYRLPTEAEWEYSARSGTASLRYGDLADIAWYSDNSGGKSRPVRQKIPNSWGLYDMLGNVAEWCSDRKGSYPSGTVVDPEVLNIATTARVIRGGYFVLGGGSCRAAARFSSGPSDAGNGVGFRPALSSVR